ncbi:MAG: hypothetical protein J6A84_00235, partial [Clostridia bacterium]|nr:hypothetical protein [Clostridia bacterium]
YYVIIHDFLLGVKSNFENTVFFCFTKPLAAFLFDSARHKEKSRQKRNAVFGAPRPNPPPPFEKGGRKLLGN